jgi:hypothetical protein
MELPKQPIVGPSVWTGSDIKQRSDWRRTLGNDAVKELRHLLTAVNDGRMIDSSLAPDLPHLSRVLTAVRDDLLKGSGFVLLQGFPVDSYAPEDVDALFLAMGRLIGLPTSQNSYGDLLGHVRDEGKRVNVTGDTRGARGYLSNEKLLFHSDLSDAVALLCIQKSISGGMSSMSSSMSVYNEILRTHPEYLPVYARGFAFRSTEADGVQTEWRLPVFTFENGMLSCAIRRMAIETARLNGVVYTDLENAALEFLDATASREDLRYDMHLEPGDIQFLNNYVTFHSRTDFVDAQEPRLKRHMLRLWLRFPGGRSFLAKYPTIYDGIPHTVDRQQVGDAR